MTERVGIVGLGLMGQALAHSILASGFEVQGFDVDPARLDQFREQGGMPAASPAAVARGVKFVLTSLPTSEIVRAAVFGPDGIAEGSSPGMLLADTTTSRPQDSQQLGRELADRGVRFLDVPVSGTSTMAWKKDLVVLAGGARVDFDACQPYFAAFSRAAHYMGVLGAGALTKLIVNLVLNGNRMAMAEGMLLGSKAGIDGSVLLTVLQDGASGSKTMEDKGPKMLYGDYTPQGQTRTSLKDSRLVLEQGALYASPMFITSLWSQLQQASAAQGRAEQDSVSYFEVLRQLAGLPARPGTAAPDSERNSAADRSGRPTPP
jgi:3-hydroxyisobutyrate dehydrogenase-like beta-hydroxyacid dehydrogenase